VLRQGYRDEEYEADKVGTRLAYKSNYQANGLLRFLKEIKKMEGSEPSKMETWISTHPPTAKRIERLEEQIAKMTSK